ncbi:hypothetical protein VTP01DRAFT_3460 [Rhizomucor pusillus]|uniref:uncharacterized protein n=1 Tax=Rhizomucor pusillus TaxID=4840 RepID=UPI003744475C
MLELLYAILVLSDMVILPAALPPRSCAGLHYGTAVLAASGSLATTVSIGGLKQSESLTMLVRNLHTTWDLCNGLRLICRRFPAAHD